MVATEGSTVLKGDKYHLHLKQLPALASVSSPIPIIIQTLFHRVSINKPGEKNCNFSRTWLAFSQRPVQLIRKSKRYVTIFFLHATVEHSLACYRCHSKKSWEDCDKNLSGIHCSNAKVCIKIERTWRDANSKLPTTSYSRLCTIPTQCTQEECREQGWNCTIECCSSNLCNVKIIVSPHALLIGVFLCLALEAINAF